MEKSNHTPTPWKAKTERGGVTYIMGWEGNKELYLATMGHGPEKDNAAFIAEACNAYESLTRELRLYE